MKQGKSPWKVTLSIPKLQPHRMSETSKEIVGEDSKKIATVTTATPLTHGVAPPKLTHGEMLEAMIDEALQKKDDRISELEQQLIELQKKYDAKCAEFDAAPKQTVDKMKKLCTNCRKEVKSNCPIMPPVCGVNCLDELV